MNIFEDLFFGKIFPCENICPKSDAYRAVNDEIHTEFHFWEERLSEADFLRLEDLSNFITKSHTIELQEAFAYGFKLSTLLLLETLKGESGLART